MSHPIHISALLGRQMESFWIYFTYPSVKESIENRRKDKPCVYHSVYIKSAQIWLF